MFNWLKNKPGERRREIRDTLFGDMPLESVIGVPNETLAAEPWASFVQAKQFMDSGDTRNAAAAVQRVLEMPQLESRHYLQAYLVLRTLAV